MKALIPPLIALAFVGFCFWFLDAMSYTNQHPFTAITLDRERAWLIEYMAEEKKKYDNEFRTIEYVHNKRGLFIDITNRTPVIKRPYDGRGESLFAQEHPASRRPRYIRQQYEDGDTILREDGAVIVVEDDSCGNDWDRIPRIQKKLKTEPFYVDPSSIPELIGTPGKSPRGQLHSLTR